MIGTLAVYGWAVAFETARRGLGGLQTKCERHCLRHNLTVTTYKRVSVVVDLCVGEWFS